MDAQLLPRLLGGELPGVEQQVEGKAVDEGVQPLRLGLVEAQPAQYPVAAFRRGNRTVSTSSASDSSSKAPITPTYGSTSRSAFSP